MSSAESTKHSSEPSSDEPDTKKSKVDNVVTIGTPSKTQETSEPTKPTNGKAGDNNKVIQKKLDDGVGNEEDDEGDNEENAEQEEDDAENKEDSADEEGVEGGQDEGEEEVEEEEEEVEEEVEEVEEEVEEVEEVEDGAEEGVEEVDGLEGDEDGPDPKISKYLEDIEHIQTEINLLNEKASEEILIVEQKYNKLRKPHYVKRNELLRNIPNFWIQTLFNHPSISPIIATDEDEECLNHLVDLDVEEFEDIKSGFRIKFKFSENPFFKNETLVKEFHNITSGEQVASSTPLDYKNTEQGKTLKEYVENELKMLTTMPNQTLKSFFAWFLESVENGTDEVAEIIKDQIWSNPLEFYLLDDQAANDSEESDDEEEEEEEDLDDEENIGEVNIDDVEEVDDEDDEKNSEDSIYYGSTGSSSVKFVSGDEWELGDDL